MKTTPSNPESRIPNPESRLYLLFVRSLMFFLKSMTSVGEQIISIMSRFAGASVSGILLRGVHGLV